MTKFALILIICAICVTCQSKETNFKDQQQLYPRVRKARSEKDPLWQKRFTSLKLAYPPQQIFIRVFKREKELEVWTLSQTDTHFQKVYTYPICRTSGDLGPKRQEGDLQIPEGFYYIDRFNPKSNFHLSLGINYPNRSDQILGTKGKLGGDIFIHGGCATIGCIPITDEYIKEVYWVAVQAKSNGQAQIPVHIFPAKLNDDTMNQLQKEFTGNTTLLHFWNNLRDGYKWFEKHKTLPQITVDTKGKYQFSTLLKE